MEAVRKDSKTGIYGVTFHGGKWEARIRVKGKNKYLGRFSTPEEAGKAAEEGMIARNVRAYGGNFWEDAARSSKCLLAALERHHKIEEVRNYG